MEIIFIGCVELGLKALKKILKDGWNVQAIFTLAKKHAGNTSGFVNFTPMAKNSGIPVYKIKNINDEINIRRIKKLNPDLIIVCGWQQLICGEVLNIPQKGTIGFHSSLLPKYRGRAPVNWAIINGEKNTGVTMFYCDARADTGDIIAQKGFSITLKDTCLTVYNKSAEAICDLIHKYMPLIEEGKVKRKINKSSKSKFWPKRNPEDGCINWNWCAKDIYNWIRALTKPYPGAFTYYKGTKYFIWKSALSSMRRTRSFRPGEIIKLHKKDGKPALLIKTHDKPIWILDIDNKNFRCEYNFQEGERFI